MIVIYTFAAIGGLVVLGIVLLIIWGAASVITGGLPSDYAERELKHELDALRERASRLHREVIAADERGGSRQ